MSAVYECTTGASWLVSVSAESTSGIAAERVACARARTSPDSNLCGSATIPLARLRARCLRRFDRHAESRRWLMWFRRALPSPRVPLDITSAAIRCGYTSEYLKMEVVYIGACVCVFLYVCTVDMWVCVWACGYVAGFLTATQQDSFFVWSPCTCVVYIWRMQISSLGFFRSSTALISNDRGKIWFL